MEFAFGIEAFEMDQMLGNVLAMGLTPVIAHPERYACVQESPERVNGWMKKGCLAQINRGVSLEDLAGVQRSARMLCWNNDG